MTPDQKRKLEEMAKDKRKHFQVLGTLTGVDSKLLIAAYEEGHSAGAQAACEMATQEERKRCAKLVSIAKSKADDFENHCELARLQGLIINPKETP